MVTVKREEIISSKGQDKTEDEQKLNHEKKERGGMFDSASKVKAQLRGTQTSERVKQGRNNTWMEGIRWET